MKKINVLAVGCNIDTSLLENIYPRINLSIIESPLEITKIHLNIDVLVWSNMIPLRPNDLEILTNLKFIINWGTNSNNIDRNILGSDQCSVLFINDYSTNTVAKFGIDKLNEYLDNTVSSKRISKLKIGIIGLGKIGFTIAKMLEQKGIKNISYNARSDKKISEYKFMSAEDIISKNDFVIIVTSSDKVFETRNLNNPGLTILNLCSDHLFATGEIDRLLDQNRIEMYMSDNKRTDINSDKALFFGKIAHKSPVSIVNKHNKLIYFLKRIYMTVAGEEQYVYYGRHGETEWNREGIYQGRLDSPPTETGVAQATRMGEFLVGKGIAEIHASPLGRSKATSKIVGEILGITPKIHGFLREQHFGSLQGMSKKDAREKHSGFFDSRSSNPWSKLYTPYPDGGESYFDVYDRVHDDYLELLAKSEGNIVFIGHESINRILRGITRDLDPADMVDNRQANNEIVEVNLATLEERVIKL